MEQFIVSARKYRPGTFESVVGQQHVTNTLKNAIRNNHLAQAFLFCGPRGVGKTTCARILAKTINCQNLQENIEPCNSCNSCTSFNQNGSFNIYELDAASNNSVDDIRGLVEQVRYAPQGAKYKIYIIDEVHMLSSAAFNAFLKTLEEPPPYAIFILATTERHKILPTILSRCQIFDFNRITIGDMVEHLKSIAGKENIQAEEEALHIIAEKADGALRDALSIFDQMVSFGGNTLTYADVIQNLNILDYDYYFSAMALVNEGDTANILLLLDDVIRKGFDSHLFLGGLCDHLRNLLVCKDPSTIGLLQVAETAAAKYHKQSATLETGLLFNALNIAAQYDSSYKSARNQRLHVELALLKLCHIRDVFSIKAGTLESDKKKDEPVKPVNKVPAETSGIPKIISAPKQNLPKLNLAFTGPEKTVEPEKKNDGPTAALKEPPAANAAPDESPTAIDFALLKNNWNEFVVKTEGDNKMVLASGMRTAKLELTGTLLHVQVGNNAVADLLGENRIELLSFLNAKAGKGLLRFEVEVVKAEETKKLYTLEDRVKGMADSNPELLNFISKLGLELDY